MAPEVTKGFYNNKVDMFSVGVIMYLMVFGVTPFNGRDDEDVLEMIGKGNVDFKAVKTTKGFDCMYLCRRLLFYTSSNRMGAHEAALNKWLNRYGQNPFLKDDVLYAIKSFINFGQRGCL